MSSPRAAALIALVLGSAACRPALPPSALDPELAACVPSDTVALAGVHLAVLRQNPVFQQLASGWATLLEPLRQASEVLVAYNGREILVIARGHFPTAPAGTRLLTPRLALAGSDAAVRAAMTQHASGQSGAPALTAFAEGVAAQPVWAVVSGGAPLPLRGNLANLNRLLAFTEHASVTAELNSVIGLHATGVCRTAERAQQLEETLRALVSLASSMVRDRDLEAVIGAVEVRRNGATVQADVSAAPNAVEKLLRESRR